MDSNGNYATELHLAVAASAATGGAWSEEDSESELECPTLKVLAERLRQYRAPVGQWARPEDDIVWELVSRVVISASLAKEYDVKWPITVRRASVLICLFEGTAGELRVILTRRAGRLSSHSGEVALPGGKRDKEDEDDIATALREAKEEIGLEPSQVRVISVVEPFLSKHLLTVTPVMGFLREKSKFKPIANPTEVESIFDAPLEMFLKEDAHRSEDHCWRSVVYRVHFFDFESPAGVKYTIWGLTAAVLIRAASIAFQHEPAFSLSAPHTDRFSKMGVEEDLGSILSDEHIMLMKNLPRL